MLDVSKPLEAIAYRIDYVDPDGRAIVTATDDPASARLTVAAIEAEGGRIVAKCVERGAEAAALMRAVQFTASRPKEVF